MSLKIFLSKNLIPSAYIERTIIEKGIKNGNNFMDDNDLPLGIYSDQTYKSGAIIRIMSGKLTNTPTQKSIHIGDNMHLEDAIGQYINHSFNPNIRVEGNKLIAIKDILVCGKTVEQ